MHFSVFNWGTKAQTLESLRTRITKAKICPSVIFTVKEWSDNPLHHLERIRREFGNHRVIVRSSALNEDSLTSTMAGTHDSVLDTPADSQDALSEAISVVVGSYYKSKHNGSPQNQLLVQPMVNNVSMSGVVFTHDLNTGGPYYVINYDDVSGNTNGVTSGIGDSCRTLLIHRGSLQNLKSPRFRALMEAITEIEGVVPSSGLDIEFAVTRHEEVYIFQVRRLAVYETWNKDTTPQVDASLNEIRSFLKPRFKPICGVLGKQSIFGIMSDWNPAEMIGVAPRTLATSLYRYLITDSVWAEARAALGYRDLSGRPLMVELGGRPYIDVRESFNSFLPHPLPDHVGEKLVSYWLKTLRKHPELHDKIEFEAAITVYSFDFNTKYRPILLDAGLTDDEIDEYAACLMNLTNDIVAREPDIISTELELTQNMKRNRERILCQGHAGDSEELLFSAKALLNDCKRFGTRSFAILARCGFIAEEFIRSLTRSGMISQDLATIFRRSVKTVLTSFLDAVHDFQAWEINKANFWRQYGHLRPNTYDILAKRYDQRGDFLFFNARRNRIVSHGAETVFDLSDRDRMKLDLFLADNGYTFTSNRLFQFMTDAMAGREYIKLKFTQNLSDALELIARWGKTMGLSRDDLSHISVWDLLGSTQSTSFVPSENQFRDLAKKGRQSYSVTKAVRLPFLITRLSDVDVIPLLKCRPNFITQGRVRGPIAFLTGQEIQSSALNDHIVLIESADPGYDWIFMNQILGLVTKYGGANSHMAIRCAELDIPAAIGCGEELFERFIKASELALDCGAELVTPIG